MICYILSTSLLERVRPIYAGDIATHLRRQRAKQISAMLRRHCGDDRFVHYHLRSVAPQTTALSLKVLEKSCHLDAHTNSISIHLYADLGGIRQ